MVWVFGIYINVHNNSIQSLSLNITMQHVFSDITDIIMPRLQMILQITSKRNYTSVSCTGPVFDYWRVSHNESSCQLRTELPRLSNIDWTISELITTSWGAWSILIQNHKTFRENGIVDYLIDTYCYFELTMCIRFNSNSKCTRMWEEKEWFSRSLLLIWDLKYRFIWRAFYFSCFFCSVYDYEAWWFTMTLTLVFYFIVVHGLLDICF
jgi:hypothetical protein